MKKVKVARFGQSNINSGVWQNISENAKELLLSMMCIDTQQRIRAERAVRHPFFASFGCMPERTSTSFAETARLDFSGTDTEYGLDTWQMQDLQKASAPGRSPRTRLSTVESVVDSDQQVRCYQLSSSSTTADSWRVRTANQDGAQNELGSPRVAAGAHCSASTSDKAAEASDGESDNVAGSFVAEQVLADQVNTHCEMKDSEEDEEDVESVEDADLPLAPFIYKRRTLEDMQFSQDDHGKPRACFGRPSVTSIPLIGDLFQLFNSGFTSSTASPRPRLDDSPRPQTARF
jgi:hypothetical protein